MGDDWGHVVVFVFGKATAEYHVGLGVGKLAVTEVKGGSSSMT